MSLYVLWLRTKPPFKYASDLGVRRDRGYPKCVHLRSVRGSVTPYCTYALTLSLFMFLAEFLFYSVLVY